MKENSNISLFKSTSRMLALRGIQSPLDTILLQLNKNDKREQKFLLSGDIPL